jgi:hypothetical protein
MALKIAVLKNHLPTCPSPFIVRSGTSDVVDFDRFLDIMAKGRTTLSRTDILATMQLYKEELQKQLSEGKTVKTPTGSFYLCAAGSLESIDESYVPDDQTNNHEVRLHHKVERDFEQAILTDLRIVREERPDYSSPLVERIQAAGADGTAAIKPGSIALIKGRRLRFDSKVATQGVFFVDAAGVEARSAGYPMILPSSVMAVVPEGLAAGTYTLVLRAAVNGKDVRDSRIEGVVIVA